MGVSEKIVALAGICGTAIDPIAVRTRSYFLGCIPITRFHSQLWVVDEGDLWRVMLSNNTRQSARRPIIGAEFRKSDGYVRPWVYNSAGWELALPGEAAEIRQRIERAIDLAYDQSLAR